MSINYMGPAVREAQEDMELLPLPVLFQYMQNPQNMSADGVAFSLIAATELARRKRLEDAATASQQPDPSRVPTIAEGLMSGQMGDTGGVPTPKTGIAAFAQPAAAPPAAPAPAPVAAAPTPAPAPAPVAMAGPPIRMAHGGIIAFNGEERSDVPKQEPLRRQYPKEMAERNILADLFSGVGPTLEDFVQGLKGFKGYEARRAEARGESKATPSGTPFPESGTELTPAPTASTAIAKPASKPVARPAVAPTPTAPAAPAAPVASTEPDAFAEAMKVLGAPPATLTPEQAEAARKQAQERLSGITDPRMARIAALQAEAEGIGSRRDEGALGRALMQLGLRTMQGGSRPGTAGSAIAGAGLEALSSYEKEQTGMIERALRTNQIKIELEKELMKQGVDRNTAADLAEREARKQVADVEREKRDSAKDLGTLAIQKQGLDVRADLKLQELALRQQIAEAQNNVRMLQISGASRESELAMLKLQNLMQQQQSLLLDRARDNVDKFISSSVPLQMEIAKNPGKVQQLYREEAARLGVKTADGITAPATGSAKFVGFEK